MPILRGNLTGSIATIPFNINCKVISFFLTSRSLVDITVNMHIVSANSEIAAIPVNLIRISGAIYTSEVPILMGANDYFIISSSGSLDYYINIVSV